jgi:ATP-binding cassette subfamily B protein
MASPQPPLQRLLRSLRPHRRLVWLAASCSVLNKLFDLAPPVLIGLAVDVVVQQNTSWLAALGVSSVPGQLGVLAALSFVIWSAESLFEYLYALLWRNLAQTVQHELRLEAYSHLQQLEMGFFEASSSGRLLAILNDDINQLERFLDHGANELLQLITTVLAVGGAMVWLSPTVAGVSFIPIPVILWGSLTFQKRLQPRYREVRERAGDLASRLANNLGGMLTIKSYVAEPWENQRLAEQSQAYRQSNAKAIRFSAAFIPLIRFAILFAFLAILVIGGLQAWSGAIAVGTYSFLVFITQRLLWPLTSLGRTLDDYQRAMASSQRVLDLIDTPIAIPELPRCGFRRQRPSPPAPQVQPGGARRQHDWHRGRHRLRQEHDREAAAAALRHPGRRDPARWPAHPPAGTGGSAPCHRPGEPGGVSLPRHGGGKHRLRQLRRTSRRDRAGGPAR